MLYGNDVLDIFGYYCIWRNQELAVTLLFCSREDSDPLDTTFRNCGGSCSDARAGLLGMNAH